MIGFYFILSNFIYSSVTKYKFIINQKTLLFSENTNWLLFRMNAEVMRSDVCSTIATFVTFVITHFSCES